MNSAKAQAGLIRAGRAFDEYAGKLPWHSRPTFYNAIARGEIPSVGFGAALYVPRWAMDAIALGDVEAIKAGRKPQMKASVGAGAGEEVGDVGTISST